MFYTLVLDLTIKKFQCINIKIVDNGKKQGDKKYDCTIQINCYIDLWFHFAHELRDFDQRWMWILTRSKQYIEDNATESKKKW